MDLAGIGLTTARVMLGNGDGTFQPAVEYPVSASAQPQALAAGDFNRDGVPDLMVTLNDPQIGLALITGLGDGSFNPPLRGPAPNRHPECDRILQRDAPRGCFVDAANAWVAFLTSPAAAAVFRSKGMEPVGR